MGGNKIKREIKLIIIMILLIMIVLSASVSAASQSFAGIPPHMYDWDSQLFSAQHGARLGAYDGWGRPSTATIYSTSSEYNADIEPSVGYAFYVASKTGEFNQEEIQKIIWSSGQWNNDSNVIEQYVGDTTENYTSNVARRSYQYGTVYHEILKDVINNYKDLFKITNEEEEVRVLVDQDTKEYTTGPYKIELNTNYTQESATFLYNELIGANSGETNETQFAKYTGLSGLNGDNSSAIFVNLEGKEISFPNFVSGEMFFIRFTPANDGDIKNIGTPIINTSYLSNFKANELVKYVPIGIQFGGSVGDYESGKAVTQNVSDNGEEFEYEQINNNYIDDNPDTLPGESEEEQINREASNGLGSDIISSVLGTLITIGLIIGAGIVAPETGGATSVLIPELLKALMVDIGISSLTRFGEKWAATEEGDADAIGRIQKKKGDLNDVNFISSLIENLFAGETISPKSIIKKIISKFLGGMPISQDIAKDAISKSIDKLNRIGEISDNERNYARRILDAYGADATTYYDWIQAVRNGYKLNLMLVLQAYGSDKVPHKVVVSDGTYKIDYAASNINVHPESTTTGTAVLTGTVLLKNVHIPVDFGGKGYVEVDIRVKIKKTVDIICRGTESWEDIAISNYDDWTIEGIASKSGEFQVPPSVIPVSHGGTAKTAFKGVTGLEKTANTSNNDVAAGIKIANNSVTAIETKTTVKLYDTYINMHLDGNVWVEMPNDNELNVDGKIGENDIPAGGIEVKLFEQGNGQLVATTTTDEYGGYSFFGLNEQGNPIINPLKKYKIEYTYNGQLYQPTHFKNNISGFYSNAKENSVERENYNNTFKDIFYEQQGYNKDGQWHQSFAMLDKIERDDGSYIDYEGIPIKYIDIYLQFMAMAKQSEVDDPSESDGTKKWDKWKSYDWVLDDPNNNDNLKNWLSNIGVGAKKDSIIQHLRDTEITAQTDQAYPVYNQFVINSVDNQIETYQYNNTYAMKLEKNYSYLYTKNSDQSRFISFGLTSRDMSNVTIQNDIYKTTLVVNGKKEEYKYNEKDVNKYKVAHKALNDLYNEESYYERKIRKSDYLMISDNENKDLDVYVTYRITAKNRGSTNISINEIVDYYDKDAYEFDGVLNSDNVYNLNSYNTYDGNGEITGSYVNSYIGSNKDGKWLNGDLRVSNVGINGIKYNDLEGQNYKYGTIYLTGLKSKNGEILKTGDSIHVYVTFKVKKDNGRIKLDDNQEGKKNIAEINAYSSYYANGSKIPNFLDGNDTPVYTQISNDNTPIGIVDHNSSPGSLSIKDLNENGDIITGNMNEKTDDGKALFNYSQDRQQNDIDKAPNLKLIIDTDDNNTRRIRGYTFEDARNNTSNTGKAVIGDGKFDENIDRKVNGVTVELVELISDVDENGIFKGTYSGEKVWATYNYNDLQNPNIDNSRYASGRGESRIIINGPEGTILHVDNDPLSEGKGEYDFKSIPPGDFFVRFKYGDTAETTMIDSTKIEDPNNPICVVNNTVGNIDGLTGKNQKSYNGQDYKSTIYQQYLTQDINYNGIRGFENSESQNYSNMDDTGTNNGTDKNSMYYYDIAVGDGSDRSVSDAKDVYYYRKRANEYSTELRNNKAEILASFMKPSTYKIYEYDESGNIKLDADGNAIVKRDEQKDLQTNMIKELMDNTHIVSQTGIINTQIEYNTNNTNALSENLHYTIEDLNLGLTERPIAQISLNNRVENVEIKLANGKTMLNTNQTVNNLFFANHQPHTTIRENIGENSIIKKNNINKNSENKNTPELILFYMDNELRENATVNIRYKLMVENTGEVDYTDKHFYYKGIENDPDKNISTTNVRKIINYINNSTKYNPGMEQNGATWKVETPDDLIPSTKVIKNEQTTTDFSKINLDYVNREYTQEVNTYNIIVTTDKLSKELVPTCNDRGESSTDEITLTLSTTISNSSEQDNLIYNNLAEIIETTNSAGRSCKFSAVGDREMPDQELGNDASSNAKSYMDRIRPLQVDTDSAQRIVILPPTG